jgi:hypothetical protein
MSPSSGADGPLHGPRSKEGLLKPRVTDCAMTVLAGPWPIVRGGLIRCEFLFKVAAFAT